MLHIVTGAVGVIGLAVFFSHYAFTVNSLPLWIILIACVLMAGYDLVSTLRAQKNGNRGDNDSS